MGSTFNTWTACFEQKQSHPTNDELKEIVGQKSLKKCPITITDINNAQHIHNTDQLQVKSKTVRRTPDRVVDWRVMIPRDWYELNKVTTLTADVLFICGLPFFITYSRNVGFTTIECIPNRTTKQLVNSLKV